MSTPDSRDPAHAQPRSGPESQSEFEAQRARAGNSAGLLWVILLVVVIGLGYWWFNGRESGPLPVAPLPEVPATVETTEPAVAPPAGGQEAAVAGPARPATSEPTPRAPVPTPTPVPARADRPPLALASNRQPDYPARALRAGLEGSISVRIDVDARGVPTDVEVVSRSGQRSRDLDRAVVDAARNWRFEPAIHDGRAVAASVVVPVEFRRQ